MKTGIVILFLTFEIIGAHADLILKEKFKSPQVNGILFYKIKGDKVRADMPETPNGSVSTISDGSTGETITLLHMEKQAYIVSGEAWLKLSPKRSAKDSGKSEKIGEYNTEIYVWSDPRGITVTLWVAKDFPNFSKFKEEFAKLKNSSVASGWNDLPGVIVRTKVIANGTESTVDLLSISEAPVDKRIFEIPNNYETIASLKYPKDFEKLMMLTNTP